jgi:hypothetical protein
MNYLLANLVIILCIGIFLFNFVCVCKEGLETDMKGADSIDDDLNAIVADINDTNQRLSDFNSLLV